MKNNRFLTWLMEKALPTLAKLGDSKYLKGIRDGIVVTVPFTIAGSIFLIIGCLPIPGWEELIAPYADKIFAPVDITFGVLAIIAVVGIGYNLAKQFGENTIMGAAMSLVGFLVLQLQPGSGLSTDNFGAEGLFTAIIVAIYAVEIQKFFEKKNIVIKLPENVPPSIGNSFRALLPITFLITSLWVIRILLGFDVTAFVTMIFQPAVFALNTLPGIIVFVLLTSLLWAVGIHGDAIMGAVAEPITLQFLAANAAAFVAGKPIPYITAEGFIPMFINIGGSGATLALVLLMIKSKDQGYKQLGRLALPSAIFEINEPVIFGFPIMLNPMMLIPFVVTPLLLTTSTYILMALNIIGRPVVAVPWTMPAVIGPYLITGGDWKAAVWSLISIIIAAVIYYPFFKACEKQNLKGVNK
ncbi:PTS sugar transporter subunit IIC [Abyssisolibacter fermentans]|uniref:PTS sugar transporter subunit IIC n=1 Tax=Abyssisolibacter fermentans TaxID=1766203 RepID=UPI00082EC26F|nr:PTS transporter subunit EIIC [Abyssisolibacter fermentans]